MTGATNTKRHIFNSRTKVRATASTFALLGLLGMSMFSGSGAMAAAPAGGDLDPTFGSNGKVITDFGSTLDEPHGMLIQSDNKIVVVGESWPLPDKRPKFTIARYNANGGLDTTFGKGGKVITNLLSDAEYPTSDYSSANAVAQQPDGKLVVVGSGQNLTMYHETFAVARYNTNGTLDKTFGNKGIVQTSIYTGTGYGPADIAEAVAIQPDGKIVAAGYTGNFPKDFAVVRYNANGTLDATFGKGGKVTTDMGFDDLAQSVVVQPDGKIVVGGWGGGAAGAGGDWAIARYNRNGTLDTTFGEGGKVMVDFLGGQDWGYDLALLPDGKILMGGLAQIGAPVCYPYICKKFGMAAAQFNPDGSLDSSFGDGGLVAYNSVGDASAYAMARRSDGKIVLAGAYGNMDFQVMVLKPNGDEDETFAGGDVRTDFGGQDRAYAVAIQRDGSPVVAGQVENKTKKDSDTGYDFGIARYKLPMRSPHNSHRRV